MAHGRTRRTQVSSQGIEDLPAQGGDPHPAGGAAYRAADFDTLAQQWRNCRWLVAAIALGVGRACPRGVRIGDKAAILPLNEKVVGFGQAGGTLAQQSLQIPLTEGLQATALGHIPCNLGDSSFGLAEAARGVLFKYPREAQKLGLGPLKRLRTVEADEGQGAPQDQCGKQGERQPYGEAETAQGWAGKGTLRRIGRGGA